MVFCNYFSPLIHANDMLSKKFLFSDYNKSEVHTNFEETDQVEDDEQLEEAFADHLLLGNRFRRTLYAGDINIDPHDHAPIALTGLALKLFSKAAPNYGLDILNMDYVSSTSEAVRISPSAMILAMIYLERLQMGNAAYLETVSPSGLFVVAMLVASKFLFEEDEDIVTNQIWAEALNFDVKDLNELERMFLLAIDWNVNVHSSEYFKFLGNVEKRIVLQESSSRNWLSYSDLWVFMNDPVFQNILRYYLKKFVKIFIQWTVGYFSTAFAIYSIGISMQHIILQQGNSRSLSQTKNMDVQSVGAVVPQCNDNTSHTAKISYHVDKDLILTILQNNMLKKYTASEYQSNEIYPDIASKGFSIKIINEYTRNNNLYNRNKFFMKEITLFSLEKPLGYGYNQHWLDIKNTHCYPLLVR